MLATLAKTNAYIKAHVDAWPENFAMGKAAYEQMLQREQLLPFTARDLEGMGTPRTLSDLQGHRALMYRGPNAVIKWQGLDEDGWHEIPLTPAFISNDGAALIAMAPSGSSIVDVALRSFQWCSITPSMGSVGASHGERSIIRIVSA